MNWTRLKAYLLAQSQEASTWRGLVLIATAIGTHISPTQTEAIVAAGLLTAGIIGAVMPDKRP